MKKQLLSRIIVISLICLFLFKVSLMGSGALVYPQKIVTKSPDLRIVQTYTPHDPIEISSDTDLN